LAITGLRQMLESYEELMRPLFLRLGGSPSQLMMDGQCQSQAMVMTAPANDDGSEAQNVMGVALRQATTALEDELLRTIHQHAPQFFEKLVIDLLLAMGYASRRRDLTRRLGQSNDGGIDGVIQGDPLGLDVILIQAKRYKQGNAVSAAQMRDFMGALDAQRASKGVFVTTSDFTAFARDAMSRSSSRIRLINGRELAGLMLRYNIGVKNLASYVFKGLDRTYFLPPLQQKPRQNTLP
jgi:restriction system protein